MLGNRRIRNPPVAHTLLDKNNYAPPEPRYQNQITWLVNALFCTPCVLLGTPFSLWLEVSAAATMAGTVITSGSFMEGVQYYENPQNE